MSNLKLLYDCKQVTTSTYLLLAVLLEADCFLEIFSALGWACGGWALAEDLGCFGWLFAGG